MSKFSQRALSLAQLAMQGFKHLIRMGYGSRWAVLSFPRWFFGRSALEGLICFSLFCCWAAYRLPRTPLDKIADASQD
jgi:hypothetical protein